MTPEKALKLFEDIRINYTNDRSWDSDLEEDLTVIDYAISLVKKEIPERVIRVPWSPTKCPTCRAELSESAGDGYYNDCETERCPDCNKLLDWSYPDNINDDDEE